jgi:hypothetical protein
VIVPLASILDSAQDVSSIVLALLIFTALYLLVDGLDRA